MALTDCSSKKRNVTDLVGHIHQRWSWLLGEHLAGHGHQQQGRGPSNGGRPATNKITLFVLRGLTHPAGLDWEAYYILLYEKERLLQGYQWIWRTSMPT